MAETEKYIVNGYRFVSRTDYERAAKEYENIMGLRDKLNANDIQGLKMVYNKLVSKNYFRTPVGFGFLHELKEYIESSEGSGEELPEVPVPKLEAKKTVSLLDDPQYVKLREEHDRLLVIKNRMIIAIVSLAVIVIGMFFIAITNDNAGYFRAEEKVLDKYSSWEEELNQREKEIRDREEALGIDESGN